MIVCLKSEIFQDAVIFLDSTVLFWQSHQNKVAQGQKRCTHIREDYLASIPRFLTIVLEKLRSLNNSIPNPSLVLRMIWPLHLTFFPLRNGKAMVMISPTKRRAFEFMNNPERLKFLSLPSLNPFVAVKKMCPE